MPTDAKQEQKGIVVSIYFDPEVLERLDYKAGNTDRSRSWMVNFILREPLGLPQKNMMGEKKLKPTS